MQKKIFLAIFLSSLAICAFSITSQKNNKSKFAQQVLAQGSSQSQPTTINSNKQVNVQSTQLDNVKINKLLPIYKNYLKATISKTLSSVDKIQESPFWNLPTMEFDFDINGQRVQMPYDPKYKIGDGFDVENNLPKASPFWLDDIIQEGTQSEEGQDGKVDIAISTSTKELATSLATSAQAWGSGWASSSKASFSYNNNYKLKTNEVMLTASHKIDLGKSLVDSSKFVLTDDAKKILATNSQQFRQAYGTHFIAGYTKACSITAQFLKTVKETEKKSEIAASLEASYNGAVYQGGGKVSTTASKAEDEFKKDIKISIQYAGANNNAFIQGIDMNSLNQAVLDFPQDCDGNIQTYILWPYESAQSYVEVHDEIEMIVAYKEMLSKQKELEELEKLYTFNKMKEEDKKKKIQEDYKKYQEDLRNKAEAKQNRIKELTKAQEKYNTGLQLLDDLFTQAILENHIIRTTLLEQIIDKKDEKQRNNDIFKLKLLELKLNFKYREYKKKLVDIENKQDAKFSDIMEVINKAKIEVDKMSSSQDKVDDVVCADINCLKCQKYNPELCDQCNDQTFSLENRCLAKCPDGYYSKYMEQQEQSICIKCNPVCLTCEETDTKCTSCEDPLLIFKNQCIEKCPNGYKTTEDKSCQQCENKCKLYQTNNCVCELCNLDKVLKHGLCVSSCGSGYFLDSNRECQKCSSNCKECQGYASRCTSCPNGKLLQGQTCQTNCNNFYYKSGSNCISCSSRISYCSQYYTNSCQCYRCQSPFTVISNKCYREHSISISNNYGGYGSTTGCGHGGALIGSCGSGEHGHCGPYNYYHTERCAASIVSSEYLDVYSAYWGYWAYCSNGGAAAKICRSGKNGDCSGYYQKLYCNRNIAININDCYYTHGYEGSTISCQDQYVIQGSCESGKNRDCGGYGVHRGGQYQIGIKCCRLSSTIDKYYWR